MNRSLFTAAALAAVLFAAGCLVEEPAEAGQRPLPVTLRMSDTLETPAPTTSLTGTWAVRQVNKNGRVYLGTLSLMQMGRLVVGRADWADHPDGHLLGWVSRDMVVFGQGFTDTAKANLLGFYAARLAGGDSLAEGKAHSNENDSGTWVAARVATCLAQPLSGNTLACPPAADSLAALDMRPLLNGCWAVAQIGDGAYHGTFELHVAGNSVTGTSTWTGHPGGTLAGGVRVEGAPFSTQSVTLIQSFTGAKANLRGHYEARFRADTTLSGTSFATEGGVLVPGSWNTTWTARRTPCLSLL